MSNAKELHDLAMDLAEYAMVARIRNDLRVARELTRRAFEYETQAADLVADQLDNEPWRSVLQRSAASLAIECGEFAEAERLIATGLAGKPPRDIAGELRDLLKDIQKKGESKDALLPQARQHTT